MNKSFCAFQGLKQEEAPQKSSPLVDEYERQLKRDQVAYLWAQTPPPLLRCGMLLACCFAVVLKCHQAPLLHLLEGLFAEPALPEKIMHTVT